MQVKILIVDDMSVNRRILIRHLELIAHHCIVGENNTISITEATNGQEAIDQVGAAIKLNAEFDLIFMDINMPVLNGYQATAAILNLNPKMNIIAYSSETQEVCFRNEPRFKGYLDKCGHNIPQLAQFWRQARISVRPKQDAELTSVSSITSSSISSPISSSSPIQDTSNSSISLPISSSSPIQDIPNPSPTSTSPPILTRYDRLRSSFARTGAAIMSARPQRSLAA